MHRWGSRMCYKFRYMKSFRFSRFPQEFQATCIVKPMRNLSICISCMKQRNEMTHKQYMSNSFQLVERLLKRKIVQPWKHEIIHLRNNLKRRLSNVLQYGGFLQKNHSIYIFWSAHDFLPQACAWNKNRQALDWRNDVFYASKFCCFNAKFSHTHSYTKQSYLNPLYQLLNFWHIFLKNAITTFYMIRFELGSRLLYGIFGAV